MHAPSLKESEKMAIDLYAKEENILKENCRIKNQRQSLIDRIPTCAMQTEWDVRECFLCRNFRGIRVYPPVKIDKSSELAISKFSNKNYKGMCAWIVCAIDSLQCK